MDVFFKTCLEDASDSVFDFKKELQQDGSIARQKGIPCDVTSL